MTSLTITINDAAASAVQEALYILRQDDSVTTATFSDGSVIGNKCAIALQTAANEVANAFAWTDTPRADVGAWDKPIRNALVYCIARELAMPIAGRMEDMKNLDALYRDKLQQAKLQDLNESLAANTDPLLAELAMNFHTDDTGLVHAYAIYTRRSSVIKSTAEREINAAHDWITAFSQTDTTHRAYPAFHDLCCFKMVTALGFAADRCQVYAQKYASNLQIAKAADLEAGKSALTDADTKEVLALISFNFTANDATMPRSISKITDRIALMKDSARHDVLLAQDWNFAKVVEQVYDCERDDTRVDGYVFYYPYPHNALRLIDVGGFGQDRNEWKIEDGLIRAKRPITAIKYSRDVSDMAKWTAFAKRAYIHRLAADVARTVMNNAQDAALQEQAYNLALENARLRDTRESSTPSDAWGANFYAEAMRRSPRRRDPWED